MQPLHCSGGKYYPNNVILLWIYFITCNNGSAYIPEATKLVSVPVCFVNGYSKSPTFNIASGDKPCCKKTLPQFYRCRLDVFGFVHFLQISTRKCISISIPARLFRGTVPFCSFQSTCSNGETVRLFSKSGDQGSIWNDAEISIYGSTLTTEFIIKFVATVGGSSSDIALDDLTVSSGLCSVEGICS